MSGLEESQPFLRDSQGALEHKSTFRHRIVIPVLSSRKQWLKKLSPVSSHFAIFLATSFIWAFIILFFIQIPPKPSESSPNPATPRHPDTGFLAAEVDYLTCGHSAEEAKTKGCEYDILSNHWIPRQCNDEYSIEEYQADGSWFPYADENRTIPLTRAELGDREFYYTSMRDHIVHCAVLWRRQYRAWAEGWKFLDDIIAGEEHTMHCSKFLIDMTDKGQDFRNIPIRVFPGKAGCHVRGV
ncbi:hypothetical protein BU26DRAFT_431083 [Trematosphaeria pertusa]|uniref:Uncharacterized protein n=1 Tax=Trematosphaeria pertusa TaxID=390896 RepID=A0A6A6I959_9PLEO|nr:uncharacterized protein BU26DRAFT_431083 [Trematosphaeria pertusa]KAF2246797.1 hypothetical protein BU26DRAFT_431083 [Trematosphaeria pertusa]